LNLIHSASGRFHDALFGTLYGRSLVYNACWEDPAVDRTALALVPNDSVLVITSAGCNALDYALAGAGQVHSVDANPRQTALLQLKLAAIASLDYDDFFALFGEGAHPRFEALYHSKLRARLPDEARAFWDKHTHWFRCNSQGVGFYHRGLSGIVAKAFQSYFRLQPRLKYALDELFAAPDLQSQRLLYDRGVSPLLWRPGVERVLASRVTMSLLGVPHAQHAEVRRQHAGGVAGFVRECVDYIARELPLADNYFWQLYLRGRYTRDCCPEYLKPKNFDSLKSGAAARIVAHTSTVTGFLRTHPEPITKFVLLDHMDWLGAYDAASLAEEWELILARAAPSAKIIFRSAHARPWFLDSLLITVDGTQRPLSASLRFDDALASRLQLRDRVHTYAGFHIAEAIV
jgi:S-adenosylmethionine-diacylglycerol 3-amino-3-carboxypropyl transferase